MTKTVRQRLLWAAALLALTLFGVAMVWLHYQQLCSPGGGNDPYTSDLGLHLMEASQVDMIYSATSLLIGPAYRLCGYWGVAVLLGLCQVAAVLAFSWGLRFLAGNCPPGARLLLSLAVYLAQAVWIPRGGYWYRGTITTTIYHNTTYIMMAPWALLAALAFYRAWQGMHSRLDARAWLAYTVLLAITTAFKANYVFAFAPALLLLLIADLVRTRGKNLVREILMGCSVLPSIAVCLIQANTLFTEEESGLRLIWTVELDPSLLWWGIWNEPAVLGLLRSLVFVAAVGLLLGRLAWQSFRYRFSLLLFCIAMAEALLLVEGGDRLYHGNLWWGPFICYGVFLLESVAAWLRGCVAWCGGQRGGRLGLRLAVCGAALAWHIISGACFLVMLLQGTSYGVPILTYNLW